MRDKAKENLRWKLYCQQLRKSPRSSSVGVKLTLEGEVFVTDTPAE